MSRHGMWRSVSALVISVASFGQPLVAADLDNAPPSFPYRAGRAVPIDIDAVEIDMTFDAASGRSTGRARVVFDTGAEGMPFLDLVPEPTSVRLDGVALSAADFAVTTPPGGETRVRVLSRVLPSASRHELDLEYPIPDVTISGGRVRAGFFMNDLASGGREFFEQYGPANLEFDQVKYTFNVRVVNAAVEHEIFANGDLEETGDNAWTVRYPDYFTTSSLYFHLTDKGRFAVQRYTFGGLEAQIPVTVYASGASSVASAVSRSRTILGELESTYGAWAHASVVIYVAGSGGMEYGGATMTDLGALGHELTHSYFARGVMPANGNAGWIDEALASWRDNGYPRGRAPSRSPVNLGGFTAYRRHTTSLAYTSGATLISEFDGMFSGNGGMRSILRQLFSEAKRTTISLPFFQSFLEQATGRDLASIFRRYVYGQSSVNGFLRIAPEQFGELAPKSAHPRPYTRAELELYR